MRRFAQGVWVVVAGLAVLAADARAAEAARGEFPFVVVFIDGKTEKELGPFPYDRAVYARAVDRAAELGARGVVIKFFLDLPRTEAGDRALAASARRTKVIFQMGLKDAEGRVGAAALPERFALRGEVAGAGDVLSGPGALVPRAEFLAAAHDVGFIDHRVIGRVPLVGRVGDRLVKSLYLCCVELALGKRAEVMPGKSVRLRGKTVELDERSEVGVEFPEKDELAYVSYADFVRTGARPAVKDRVVILAYDSERFVAVDTPMGRVRPHRAFVYVLRSVYRRFSE